MPTVKEIIADHLGISAHEVKNHSRIVDDLGADSLDVVEIIMEIEHEFSVVITGADIERISTVEQLKELISK